MKRILLTLFMPLYRSLLCCTTLAVLIYVLFVTPYGLNLTAELAIKLLPGKLSFSQLQGNLASGIALKNVSYSNAEFDFHSDNINLSWNLAQIFHKKIIINYLKTSNIIVNAHFQQNADNGFNFATVQQVTSILNYLRLNNIAINNVTINQVGNPAIHVNAITLTQISEADYYANSSFSRGKILGKLEFNYTNGDLIIHSAHILSDQTQFVMRGKLTKTWDMTWKLNIKKLANIDPDLRGTLNCDGIIHGPVLSPQFTVRLSIANPVLTNLALKANQISANLNGNYNVQKHILKIEIKNAKLTTAQVQTLRQINIALHGLLTLAGELTKPDIDFSGTVDAGNASIPDLGVKLITQETKLTYHTNQPLRINANVASGTGNAHINGTLLFGQSIQGVFKIIGQNLQTINLNHYQANVSPNLELAFKDNKITIKGSIAIPYAKISPTNFDNVTTLPDEVTFVGEKSTVPTLITQMTIHVGVALSKQIYISYKNLQTNLAGNLQIDGEPGKILQGIGSLYALNGKYSAYGKQLTIDQGRLIYAGNSLFNPGLDIRATQKIKTLSFNGSSQFTDTKTFSPVYTGAETITVGILVKGTLNKPILSLYSDSNLNQDDILSYLIFGYPRSQITKTSSLALLNSFAADMKTGKTSVFSVKNNLQNMLGLSEMDIGTTEYFSPTTNTATNTTAVNLGKKIGKRLYVHYSVGIFSPIQILNLKYQINKHLSVQSETSTLENGADVLYELERA